VKSAKGVVRPFVQLENFIRWDLTSFDVWDTLLRAVRTETLRQMTSVLDVKQAIRETQKNERR